MQNRKIINKKCNKIKFENPKYKSRKHLLKKNHSLYCTYFYEM